MIFPPLNKAWQANNWAYVGEGNQNLVVRYIGSDKTFIGKVLRVVKSNDKNKHVDGQTLLSQKEFVDRVVRPLLGKEYVLDLQPISTGKTFLDQLATHVQSARPSSRLKTKIITDAPLSFIMTDLTQIWPGEPTLTFELKPKWGFKPSCDTVTKIKLLYCRFCMHAHLRETDLDGYCPMNLYSDSPTLIDKALTVLLRSSPQEKTLRVSINGQDTCLMEADPDAEYKALLGISSQQALLPEILKAILIQDPILLILKTLQADLDSLDVENILPLYQQQRGSIKTDIDTFADVADNYKKRILHPDTPITDTQRVLEYVLSMTFKDCSIMINVAPATAEASGHKFVTLDNRLTLQYDVKVIDTDLKKLDKIPYWHELDQGIVSHAIETGFSRQAACFSNK
ncbi:inositol-pentakisphosphate 2-kinase isoform X2 [Mucor ambiguus]|uniref:Inositol-pentakisphosphate 2-kinase n=1 Tax=Mucor ambiguus TaxID=91626 RepID=A0A0C9LU22_9FUNG|nr:inositol-pentakisphosphate 2-kinase isoform X2 [Mucor ambiguus]